MNTVETYLEIQVMTAPPYRLHLLVIEGALRFARRAEQALRERDIETAFLSLSRSRDCVTELMGGLDETRAPELVEPLKALFAFAYENLAYADFEKDPRRVRNAIRVLEKHRETWLELAEKLRTDEMTSEPTAERSWVG